MSFSFRRALFLTCCFFLTPRWTCGRWGSPTASWASPATPVPLRPCASATPRSPSARAVRPVHSRSGTWRRPGSSVHIQVTPSVVDPDWFIPDPSTTLKRSRSGKAPDSTGSRTSPYFLKYIYINILKTTLKGTSHLTCLYCTIKGSASLSSTLADSCIQNCKWKYVQIYWLCKM